MAESIKKQLTPKKFRAKELNKSKGILDDHAVRKVISTKEGTITKVPVNGYDIVNKEYADAFAELDPVFVAWDKDHADLSNVTASQHHTKAVSGDIDHNATVNTHNLTTDISHDSIADVSANDHHAQAHTLASHSTKAHSELTGVTANQHHNESHTHPQYLLLQPTANVVINEAGGDFTFRIESFTDPNLFSLGYVGDRIGFGVLQPYRKFHFKEVDTDHAYLRLEAGTTGKHPVIELVENGTRRGYLEYNSTQNFFRIQAEETNSDITFVPNGTGRVRFGAYVAEEPRAIGYIEIKDAGGTVRKLMVCS